MRTKSKSSITTDLLHNPHPGEILLEEFLKPLAFSQSELARTIGVAPRRINEIVLGKRAVTADTDLRLARYFGVSEGFFLGLQADYELMQRRRQIGDKLKSIRPRAAENVARKLRARRRPESFARSRSCRSALRHGPLPVGRSRVVRVIGIVRVIGVRDCAHNGARDAPLRHAGRSTQRPRIRFS